MTLIVDEVIWTFLRKKNVYVQAQPKRRILVIHTWWIGPSLKVWNPPRSIPLFRRSAKPVAQQQSFQASHGLSNGLTLHRWSLNENLWKLKAHHSGWLFALKKSGWLFWVLVFTDCPWIQLSCVAPKLPRCILYLHQEKDCFCRCRQSELKHRQGNRTPDQLV